MTILWKRQKKKCKCKNRIGEDIDKKSTTHTIEKAAQWPTSAALNTRTLKGLGGGCRNHKQTEIQVVIKNFYYTYSYTVVISIPQALVVFQKNASGKTKT